MARYYIKNIISFHIFFRANVRIKGTAKLIRYKVVLTNGVELVIPKARYTYVKEQFVSYQGEV